MTLLLDTQFVVYLILDDRRLPRGLEERVMEHETLVSAASVWEVAIKRSLKKLDLPADSFARLIGAGVRPLPITFAHVERVETLPWHHRDPFDRLLIAQAQVEGASIVSGDPKLRPYGVDLIW